MVRLGAEVLSTDDELLLRADDDEVVMLLEGLEQFASCCVIW
jgi:hypothetical protein